MADRAELSLDGVSDPNTHPLRDIPPVQSLLERPEMRVLCAAFSREEVTAALRSSINQVRVRVLSGQQRELPDFVSDEFFSDIKNAVELGRANSLRRVINATGIVIHTNLGRAPLAKEAVEAMTAIAGSNSNLEFDLESARRGSRYDHVEALVCELTGAEGAVVVNNCAAAIFLCLSVFARGREVIASRGELIEIGGSFRMPDVIEQSGATLVEVGTTNKTRISDYADAITPETSVLLKSHTSNYKIVGFSSAPSRAELVSLGHEHDLTVVEDLGSGVLVDLAHIGLPDEPIVANVLRQGVDLVTFSGDKLLGGPQAGIIAGRRDAIDQLKRHPLLRTMRIDKLSLAALEATLRLYPPYADPFTRVPVLRRLATSIAELHARAQNVVVQCRDIEGLRTDVVESVAYAGGGGLPQQDLQSVAVALKWEERSTQKLADWLRQAPIPVIGRLEADSLLLDMRTIEDEDIAQIIEALKRN